MKTKLVLWGTNAQDERILLALNLEPSENKVTTYMFPVAVVDDDFHKAMMDDWRNDKEVAFPEGHHTEEAELSMTGTMLPEGVVPERDDLIQRAQTEWHFIVLSSKMNENYQAELDLLADKVHKLEAYDAGIWEQLKGFWGKVQEQVKEKNLMRDHANVLRDNTNELFARMKELRSKMDEAFNQKSNENRKQFEESLVDVENRIKEGKKLQAIFEELKKLQQRFRNTKFNREDRAKVWERLDAAFKEVKEKRFGTDANVDRSPLERLQRRFNGLLEAIKKMERSIKRDEDELEFQNRRIERSEGQLEAQLRQAKTKMIEERVRSKKDKHADMLKTKTDLEKRMEVEQEKDAKRKERQKVEEAKKQAADKIAKNMEQQAAKLEDKKEDLQKAADSLKEEAPKTELSEQSVDELADLLQDAVQTGSAVAELLGGKTEQNGQKEA